MSGSRKPKLNTRPKTAKYGQIEFAGNSHDPKRNVSFTMTITDDLNEAPDTIKPRMMRS
jgi:hypothetical protein